MLLPTSSEFVALCQAQVSLLTQGLGASLSVVYLTQQLVEGAETQLVPIVAYPETAVDWDEHRGVGLPSADTLIAKPTLRLLAPPNHPLQADDLLPAFSAGDRASSTADPPTTALEGHALVPQRQLVLPLIHEDVVLGLLVVGRDDRGWSEWEQHQIEQIAATIALACVLDQRYQWLEHEQQQQQLLQAQQHDVLDNLLHQFRNSLTALQTFGKLILKRLLPGDPNHNVATSILRETTRLQELSQQLESATGMDRQVDAPRSLPPTASDWQTYPPEEATQSVPQTAPRLLGAGLSTEIALPLEHCSVASVLEPLLASAQPIAQDRNLSIDTQIPADLPLVWANAQALREVLNNLLENALKYTPTGGQVTVEAHRLLISLNEQATEVEISVSDTGPGIPAQDLPHIFERRYRGVQAQTGIPGSGLGLAIAKVLVEQMHGRIHVISPAQPMELSQSSTARAASLGPGTQFVVQLPAVEAA